MESSVSLDRICAAPSIQVESKSKGRELEKAYQPSCRKIGSEVYWLSIPDIETKRFENLWPLSNGVNYNAYLIGSQGEYLLIDSSKRIIRADQLLDLIKTVVDPSKIKHVAILHTEPDHSGLIGETSRMLAGAALYSTSRASAFMKTLFNVEPRVLKDGETLKVGTRALRVIELPWIHWPDTMLLHLEDEGILFTSDAFGAFGALKKPVFDDEVDFKSYMERAKDYFSTVVVAHRQMILRDLEKIKTLGLDIKMIAPSHGIVLRSKIQEYVETLTSWCKLSKKRKITVVYASMYGNTEKLANFAAKVLEEKAEVALLDATEDTMNLILSDILDSAGTLFVTPTYEANVFPPISNLLELLRIKKLGEGKLAAALVTKLWGGHAPTLMTSRLKETGYTLFDPVCDYVNYPSEQDCRTIRGFLSDFSEKALQNL